MKIKVCGLRDKQNIQQIAAMQFDYMGFIFYPKSKRFVGDDFVMPEIDSKIKKTGVFVNADIKEVIETVNKYKLNAVQLHGDESPAYCEEVNEQLTSVEIIKAFGIDETFSFEGLKAFEKSCDYFLFDTKTKDYGGSGHKFSWDVLKKYDNAIPYFLSGGISIDDLEYLKKEKNSLNFYAIDVNSKFEIEPGLKDMKLIEKLRTLKD